MSSTSPPPLEEPAIGRRRKFVAVVDETPECRAALRFAAGRAGFTPQGQVVILYVIAPMEFVQWSGVQEVMAQEAREQAEALLDAFAVDVEKISGVRPEIIIRQGKPAEQVMALINEDRDIVRLILAASAKGDPGPLVGFFSGPIAGSLPCPVTIVPGAMPEDLIDTHAQFG